MSRRAAQVAFLLALIAVIAVGLTLGLTGVVPVQLVTLVFALLVVAVAFPLNRRMRRFEHQSRELLERTVRETDLRDAHRKRVD